MSLLHPHPDTKTWRAPTPQIYLNPDNDAVWAEKESADPEESRASLEAARALLQQVRWRCWTQNCHQGT